MSFFITVYIRHGDSKWHYFDRANEPELNCEIVRTKENLSVSNINLLTMSDNHETKIRFHNGNYVVDKMIIPANPDISIQAFNRHVDKYLPELERKLAKLVNLREQVKIARLLEKMEKRNKKSK